MKRLFRVAYTATVAAALASVSHAYALDTCRIFRDSDFGGGFVDIAKNTSLPDLGAEHFVQYGTTCVFGPGHGDPEGGSSRCSTAWSSTGNAQDEVSSVQVPTGCYLYLYQDPRYSGPQAAWEAGDHPQVYTGISNDAASSAYCSCRIPPVAEVVIVHPPR